MQNVFTIGYEGSDIPRFVSVLLSADIDTLVDVRALPLSRKKGFSKTALREHLEDVGIEYCHYRELGNPKVGRDAARSGQFDLFTDIYKKQFCTADAQEAFKDVLELASNKIVCLMCFEHDVKTCHRDIITDEMEIRGFDCIDLLGDDPEHYVRKAQKLPSCYPYQGIAAAE